MSPRYALVIGLGVALAGSASAQVPPPAHQGTPPPPAKPAASGAPRTLAEALAATYSNQPALQAERAKLRATDENVPTALAGWRPTVVMAGTAGYGDGLSRAYSSTLQDWQKLPTDRDIATAQATVTQPIYNGGRTQANVNRAKDQVMAERANLLAQEQTSFTNTVNAYVGVIQAQDLLTLNINNEQVLQKQLDATNDRFRVGEITRTDVAQAEAALAGATAQRQTAEGNLATARATFVQIVGFYPPADLVEPQPLALPIRAENDAAAMAAANNPNVISAQFNDSAAKDAVGECAVANCGWAAPAEASRGMAAAESTRVWPYLRLSKVTPETSPVRVDSSSGGWPSAQMLRKLTPWMLGCSCSICTSEYQLSSRRFSKFRLVWSPLEPFAPQKPSRPKVWPQAPMPPWRMSESRRVKLRELKIFCGHPMRTVLEMLVESSLCSTTMF